MLWKTLSAASFAGVIALALTVLPTISQQTTPTSLPGCIYISAGTTLTNLQTIPLQCDINGHLKVNTAAAP